MALRLVALAAALCAATVSAQSLEHVQGEFEYVGASARGEIVHFSAALPMENYDVLQDRIAKISDPQSPLYGNWMTGEEVNSLIAPKPEVRTEVREWVTSTGAVCLDYPRSLRCSGTVEQVETLLSTKISAFKQHTRNGQIVHRVHPRDHSWSIPERLQGKLLFLTNLVDFPTVRRRNGVFQAIQADHVTGRVQATDYTVVPETLNDFYNIGSLVASTASSAGPAEFQNDTSYNKKDLETFAKEADLKPWNASHTIGPYDGGSPDAEASLDFQYLGAVAASNGGNLDLYYWTEPLWMLEFTEHIASLPDTGVPSVFSISWGWSEADQCTIDPAGPCKTNPKNSFGYVAACNQGFAAATARGISFLVSSGDSGAHGRTDPSCSTPKTHPDWPTASEYITAVGATQIKDGVSNGGKTPICTKPPAGLPTCATGGTEITCSVATGALIVSGGGFSNVAPTQSWQAAAVKAYLASGATLPPTGDFNATGRGYPDVAALGHNYIIYLSGQPLQVDGTSCSAPVWGGIISLANSARLAAGKKVLGFLNPALYQIAASTPSVFHDVTVGDNKCTEDGCSAGCTGFEAAKGWDSATGWGTPDVTALVKALSALP